WLDENGRRSPVAGVRVTLWRGSAYVAETVTDENGSYRFDGLWPDSYSLSASVPAGLIFVRPNDPNYQSGASVIASTDSGMSDPFALLMAQHQLDREILYIKSAKVGDIAWLDENRNGLLDGGERFIPGVTVRLLQDGQTIYETTTDAYGYYLFDEVYPGEYVLEASAYAQLTPTTPVESLRIISSCLTGGDGLNARSEGFRVESGERNLNFDLGYVLLDGQSIPEAILAGAPGKDWSIHNRPKE
ncbi:MAG: SdrD B-like domain-containing protein, partial [Clostridia bacterium]|nr:SdrD B-like domain-containing protein [Clostridia bacterium]